MINDDIVTIDNANFSADRLEINWRVTSLCNYRCEFCIQGDHKAHARLAKGESRSTRSAICKAIRNLLDTTLGYTRAKVALIGGEVTILKDFPDILETLVSSSFAGELAFDITTNLSASADRFIHLARLVGDQNGVYGRRKLQLTASFYRDYVDAKAFSAKLIEIKSAIDADSHEPGRRLPQKTLSIGVSYPMLTDDDYRGYLSMRTELDPYSIGVLPLPIRQFPTSLSPEVSTEIIVALTRSTPIKVTDRHGVVTGFQSIQALGAALEDTDRFCPEGFICDAGTHSIFLSAFGDAHRCPAIGSTMSIGNIIEGGIHLLQGPEPCTCNHCSCTKFGRIQRIM